MIRNELGAPGLAAVVFAGLALGCAHRPATVARDRLDAVEHAELGAAYERRGLRNEAAAQYRAAAALDSKYAEAWLGLGNIAFQEGHLVRAEKLFRRALKAAPQHAGVANSLANILLTRHRHLDEAEALVKQALLQDGQMTPVLLDTLANIYVRQQRYADALALLDQAEAGSPPRAARYRDSLAQTRRTVIATLAQDSTPRRGAARN